MKASMIAILVALMACVSMVQASQLFVQSGVPWVAYGNGTKYDISKVFDFANGPVNAGGYWYNPLGNVSCPGAQNPNTAALCQKADRYYNIGQFHNPIWLLNSNGWTIYYTNGEGFRFSIVTFIIDQTVEKPTFTFTNESPLEQYNLVVRGKCLGQPFSSCSSGSESLEDNEWLLKHQKNVIVRGV
eukprot:TRINITY_DN291_c0_g2_i1.p1 TRINITY_DN291_c0_g2~~TRINITY_DN291_c0_g2_i1.p1  ORF type:complete len:216 (-),score=94.08 TRINITY_DN291_c0_g2_i1:46-603(-)